MISVLNTLSFETPLALWGLGSLPIIWWLLQFTPPRPQSIAFPPLRILLGLKQQEETPDKTPWWLLLLRLTLAAILIIAVAHPLTRSGPTAANGTGPLLLIMDDGWAAAKAWNQRADAAQSILEETRESARPVILATTTPTARPANLVATSASDAINVMRAIRPNALSTDRLELLARLKSANLNASQVLWLSDGLDTASAAPFTSGLQTLFGNAVTALTLPGDVSPIALARPAIDGGDIKVTALRGAAQNSKASIQATAGNGRILAQVPIDFGSARSISTKLSLPVELRNEIQSITIAGENQAGAKQLLDDRWRRKTIAIQSGVALEAAQPLLSPLHYVTRALEPYAEIAEPTNGTDLKAALDAGLSMLVLADIGTINSQTHDDISAWLEKGGVLLRFAGPHLAATTDDLLPVTLREGDRNLGSALSWETPQAIQSFSEKSPFAGLKPDSRIAVSRQVLAEPDATLPDKTWVSLADGTPLVTATHQGKGLLILFHVTANADWSNLPLSGTFVDMLQRIVDLAPAAGSNTATATQADGNNNLALRLMLNGAGELVPPSANTAAIAAAGFDAAKPTPQTPPGLYAQGATERAINLDLREVDLAPITNLANGMSLQTLTPPKTTSFAAPLFIAAALLFLLDTLAAIFLGGGLKSLTTKSISAAFVLVFAFAIALHVTTPKALADDEADLLAATQTHLAYVKTGNADIDDTSEQGLRGLGAIIADRTSAVLGAPTGIDVEKDDLVFYPLLYWPVTEAATAPSDAALSKLDSFMKNGGTIFFDLRDAGTDFGTGSANGEALKRILAKLDIPPLEPVPVDHALTKSFYLLKDWPGRYEGGTLWVEAQNGDSPTKSDGVSGLVIGSNDYAAAWAMDDQGNPTNAVIPGSDRQREIAYRVGVNMVMYALTGNYKTDQVHIPALLERLGQ